MLEEPVQGSAVHGGGDPVGGNARHRLSPPEAAASVQSVASAAEELSASIAEIGRHTADAMHVSRDAVTGAEHAAGFVAELATAVGRIEDIGPLINAIVVAGEVKSLAAQTGRATDDIARQIAAIQEVTHKAAATRKISRNVLEAANGTHAVNEGILEASHLAGRFLVFGASWRG